MHFEMGYFPAERRVEFVFGQVDKVLSCQIVVHVIKGYSFFSASEFNVSWSFSGFSCVSKVDKVPFSQIILVFNWLVDVRIALAIEISVWISGKTVHAAVSASYPHCKISISQFHMVSVGLLIVDRHSESQVPGLLLLQGRPLEPTRNSVFVRESILSRAYYLLHRSVIDFEILRFAINTQSSLLCAVRIRFRIASDCVFHDLSWVAQEWTWTHL